MVSSLPYSSVGSKSHEVVVLIVVCNVVVDFSANYWLVQPRRHQSPNFTTIPNCCKIYPIALPSIENLLTPRYLFYKAWQRKKVIDKWNSAGHIFCAWIMHPKYKKGLYRIHILAGNMISRKVHLRQYKRNNVLENTTTEFCLFHDNKKTHYRAN